MAVTLPWAFQHLLICFAAQSEHIMQILKQVVGAHD